MYQKRVRNIRTGETAIVVACPIEDCPNLDVAPDDRPQRVICWPKNDCQIVTY